MSSMTMPSRRRAAGPGIWLALLALWVQALLPAVHHPASAMTGPFAFGIVSSLCLAPGNIPAGPQDKGPAHKLPPCPVCQTLQILAAGFAPADAIAIPLPRYAGVAAPIAATHIVRPPRLHSKAQARAPPVLT